MPALFLNLLKLIFLALIYLFLWQVARSIGRWRITQASGGCRASFSTPSRLKWPTSSRPYSSSVHRAPPSKTVCAMCSSSKQRAKGAFSSRWHESVTALVVYSGVRQAVRLTAVFVMVTCHGKGML